MAIQQAISGVIGSIAQGGAMLKGLNELEKQSAISKEQLELSKEQNIRNIKTQLAEQGYTEASLAEDIAKIKSKDLKQEAYEEANKTVGIGLFDKKQASDFETVRKKALSKYKAELKLKEVQLADLKNLRKTLKENLSSLTGEENK